MVLHPQKGREESAREGCVANEENGKAVQVKREIGGWIKEKGGNKGVRFKVWPGKGIGSGNGGME